MSDGTGAGDELVNLRDLGGLTTHEGAQLAPGRLYRSEAPFPGDRAPTTVPAWPPRTVVDLRYAGEGGPDGHPLAGVAEIRHVPMERQLSPTAERPRIDDLAPLYDGMVRDHGPWVAGAVAIVADAAGPVLLHCFAGKDRTGVVLTVLLRALGVARADVLADYRATGDNLDRLWRRMDDHGVRVTANPAVRGISPAGVEAVMDRLDAHPGGASGWLDGAVGAPVTAALRQRLLA